MIVYRLSRTAYANDLSGKGAARHGGRWNRINRPMLYCSLNQETALLECLIHILPAYLNDMKMAVISVPNSPISQIKVEDLPANWNTYPAPEMLGDLADDIFRRTKCLAIQVPCAVVPAANNILIDPLHPDFQSIEILSIHDFKIDHRLLKEY